MEVIVKTLIFTAGQALAFHVILPVWYVLIQLSKLDQPADEPIES